MHTLPVLQKLLRVSLPTIHARRLETLTVAVDAVMHGARVSITSMGRSLPSATRIKHRVKRMDRLVGNPRLHAQRVRVYRAILSRVLCGCIQPVILIDWSDFSTDRQQQLLRASIPMGGRAVTLYEELHPVAQLGNRRVQHRFIDQLEAMLPANCVPIIIADSGFRVPFFQYVESLGWHWLGRIRNRDLVVWEGAPYEWIAAKSLYVLATTRPKDLGTVQWVRRCPLAGRLVLIRQPKRGRKDRGLNGVTRHSRLSRKHAQRSAEPWLLIASDSLAFYRATQIVNLYKTRMHIEENFRDTKSVVYGLGIARGRYTSFERATNLLLIAALAMFALWVIGSLAKRLHWEWYVRVNSSSRTPDYSCLFLARLVIQHLNQRLPRDCLTDRNTCHRDYLNTILRL